MGQDVPGHSGTETSVALPPSRRMEWLWHSATLAFLAVGPHQARLRPGLSCLPPPTASPELSLTSDPRRKLPQGNAAWSGKHPLAVPDCHPREVTATSRKPSLGRTVSSAGALWARHWDRESWPQKQLVGRGRGLGQCPEGWLQEGREPMEGVSRLLSSYSSTLHAPCPAEPLLQALGTHPRTENSKAPALQTPGSCQS